MANLLRLELDCTSDDCLSPTTGRLDIKKMTALTKKCAKEHKVKAELVDPNGPGGGCPVYAFTGTREQLIAYMTAHHNPGLKGKALQEEFEYYLESAEEA